MPPSYYYRRDPGESDWSYFGRMQSLIDAGMAEGMPEQVQAELAAYNERTAEGLRSDPDPHAAPAFLRTPTLEDEPGPEPLAEVEPGPVTKLLDLIRTETERHEYDEDGQLVEDEDKTRWTETIRILDGSETIEPLDPTGRYSRGKRLQPKDHHPVFRALRRTPPKVVFVPKRDPYSLSNLYRQARTSKRRIRIEMAQARVDGVLGTIIKNMGPAGVGE